MKKFIVVLMLMFVTISVLGETLSVLPEEYQNLYQRYSFSNDKGNTYIERLSEPGLFIITPNRVIFKNNAFLTIKSVDRIEDKGLVNYLVIFSDQTDMWLFSSIKNQFTEIRIVSNKFKERSRQIFRIDK